MKIEEKSQLLKRIFCIELIDTATDTSINPNHNSNSVPSYSSYIFNSDLPLTGVQLHYLNKITNDLIAVLGFGDITPDILHKKLHSRNGNGEIISIAVALYWYESKDNAPDMRLNSIAVKNWIEAFNTIRGIAFRNSDDQVKFDSLMNGVFNPIKFVAEKMKKVIGR